MYSLTAKLYSTNYLLHIIHLWPLNFSLKQFLKGNENTYSNHTNILEIPVVGANLIRLFPYSQHARTSCFRFELFGCLYKGKQTVTDHFLVLLNWPLLWIWLIIQVHSTVAWCKSICYSKLASGFKSYLEDWEKRFNCIKRNER